MTASKNNPTKYGLERREHGALDGTVVLGWLIVALVFSAGVGERRVLAGLDLLPGAVWLDDHVVPHGSVVGNLVYAALVVGKSSIAV